MEVLKHTTPKARKQHQCDYCYGIIEIGEVYDHQTNKMDGDLYTWKSHKKCSKIANDLKMYDHKYEGLTGDDFHEGINEWYDMLDGEHGKTFEERLDFVIENNHKIKR